MADSAKDAPKTKKKKGMTADIGGLKIKVKAKKSGKKDGGKKGGKSKGDGAFEAFAKLAESPLVADLIAVGATAAVAALTESIKDRSDAHRSKTAVKSAGKAAAAAIGRRLMSEYEAVKAAGKDAAGKAKG